MYNSEKNHPILITFGTQHPKGT